MVGSRPGGNPMTAPPRPIDPAELGVRLDALEGIDQARDLLAGQHAYLVGGAVRDLLLGRRTVDLDLVVEGDALALARRGGARVRGHDRFRTATVELGGLRADLASARREDYGHPGALPTVSPAGIQEDLARRDFTINAMAVPILGDTALIDPHDGLSDLRAGRIRVLHARSFVDDPTRALRAARYAARLDFGIEEDTARLLGKADLSTVSAERVQAELERILAEEGAPDALALLADWNLAEIDEEAPARIRSARRLLAQAGWDELASPDEVLPVLVRPAPGLEATADHLAASSPARASQMATLARGRGSAELVLARIRGAEWIDDWVRDHRHVHLEIDGTDLLAAGVAEGPGVGAALAAALTAKLDGEAAGREEELEIALRHAS